MARRRAAADWGSLGSDENYVGLRAHKILRRPEGLSRISVTCYTAPERLKLNHWALSGDGPSRRRHGRLSEANGT